MLPSENLYTSFKLSLLVVFSFSFFAGCQSTQSTVPANALKPTVKPPVVVKAGQPDVVNLDTCPKPQTILVPTRDSVDFTIKNPSGETKLKLTPPPVHAADFFISMQKFGNKEGLEAHSVYSSFQDKAGNLWFGTHGGSVTRFDGKTAVTFSNLMCNDIRAIIEDTQGNIWLGTGGCGLVKYDGVGFTNYTEADGLVDNEVRSLALDIAGNIWIGAENKGVSFFDGRKFKNYHPTAALTNNRVKSIACDSKGNMWFGTDSGASWFNGRAFTMLRIPGDKINNNIAAIACSKSGDIWFGTANGIYRYHDQAFTHFTMDEGLPGNSINCLAIDENENLWIGIFGAGISKYDGHSFENLSKKQGLASDFIMTMTAGSNGSIWIGAEGGGITRYDGSAIKSYTTEQGLFNNYIISMEEDGNGNLWLGSNSGGVTRYDGKSFANYSPLQGFTRRRVYSIYRDSKDNLWFCTDAGFSRYDGKAFTNYNTFHGIRSRMVECVTEDSTGNFWFGVENGGLSMFNGKKISNFTVAQGLPGDVVRAIIYDAAHNFWIATYGSGISRFDGKTFMNFDTAQGLVSNHILCMRKDSRGNLWIGTGINGVSIMRRETIAALEKGDDIFPATFFESFTTNEGLANNTVYDIAEDHDGNIMVGTNFGLTVVKNGILPGRKIQSADIEYYNEKNGYPITDMNNRAMHVDKDGALWAGTGGDLIKFNYDALRKNRIPPNISIQGIKINNENPGWYYLHFGRKAGNSVLNNYMRSAVELEELYSFSRLQSIHIRDSMRKKFENIKFDSIARYYPVPINMVLPYKHNNVTIEFGAIEGTRSEFVKYQYMLEGYDKSWSPVTNQSFASFGNIREGRYTFKVKAMSPDGVWSKPAVYSFKVSPPWRRSWIAIFLYADIVFLFLYLVYINRIRKIHAKQALELKTVIATQEEERKRISRDLHDDVGTKLSALKLFLVSLKTNIQKQQYQQVDQLAHNSEQLINDTIKDVREMLFNLSPGILEEFGYVSAIESLVNKINQTNTIHFQLSVFGMKGRLSKELELALYRITQELINNVLKHSEAKMVSLQIGYRDEKIIVMIEDDGKGFDVSQHKDGYGFRNLEARTTLLDGYLNIDSLPGKGTSVLIEVPYKFNP